MNTRSPCRSRRGRALLLLALATVAAACTSARAGRPDPIIPSPTIATAAIARDAPDPPSTTDAPPTNAPTTNAPTTEPPMTGPATTDPATIITDAPTAGSSATEPAAASNHSPTTEAVTTDPVSGAVQLPAVAAAFFGIAARNAASSITIIRDHRVVHTDASGFTLGLAPVTSDTPLVIASVSKLVTALTIARLTARGEIDVTAPVPWDQTFISHDPAWNDVTARELLDHTAGMPKAQQSWLNEAGSCASPLGAALAGPPTSTRGRWTYSNGNYCALGLLVEAVTGASRDIAADTLVFDPIGVSGPHLTTDPAQPTDGPYGPGVARLERLGGAGTWMASTDDIAAMLDSVTDADLETVRYPGIMADQYGWGHTGTVDGAKSCAWVTEGGRTVIVATVAGSYPATGGKICDLLVPALAADLGFWAGPPVRLPD